MLHVNLLGTGGTYPLKDRMLSSAIVQFNGQSILFDCGEGTQISLKRQQISANRIGTICFTHFHADHISGLPGLLLTMGIEMREKPVTIIGPVGITDIVRSLCVIAPNLPYELRFIELTQEKEEVLIDGIRLRAFRVDHTVDCYGYTAEIDRMGKFSAQKARENNVPMKVWKILQQNESTEYEGVVYTRDMAFEAARRGIKILYCTDTRPTDVIREMGQNADLMILEGMFAEEKKLPRALETHHMMYSEAATLAKEAGADELWLTHYSPSMKNPEQFLSMATNIFENTICGTDTMEKELNFCD